MIRRAFTMRLKPDSLSEYKFHHDHIWPELVAEIERAGIASITTFQRDLDLFLVSEIVDEAAWDKLWNSETHKRWAEVMQPLMHLRDDGIVDSGELTEIFHLVVNERQAGSPAGETRESPSAVLRANGRAGGENGSARAATQRAHRKVASKPARAGKKIVHQKKSAGKSAKRKALGAKIRLAAKTKKVKKSAGKRSAPKTTKRAAKKKTGRKKRG